MFPVEGSVSPVGCRVTSAERQMFTSSVNESQGSDPGVNPPFSIMAAIKPGHSSVCSFRLVISGNMMITAMNNEVIKF